MAITGTGKSKRDASMVFMNVGTTEGENPVDEYEVIGKGIPDMTRERNNEVKSEKDILGNTETTLTTGAQVTSVEPANFRKESKVSKILYDIYKYDKELDDVKFPFVEVFTDDVETSGEYAAFKQDGVVDLKSFGGAAVDGLTTPFDINWTGAKTHGTFNPTTKKFTPTIPTK